MQALSRLRTYWTFLSKKQLIVDSGGFVFGSFFSCLRTKIYFFVRLFRLFDYIQGDNKNSSHIPMTAPVLTTILPSAGPFCSSAFTVKFYIPSQFSSNPPVPKNSQKPNLVIERTDATCVAVRKFGGFAADLNVAKEASNLAESLKNSPWKSIVNESESAESYSVAQYNSPFEFVKRVNEIWVKFSAEKFKGCVV